MLTIHSMLSYFCYTNVKFQVTWISLSWVMRLIDSYFKCIFYTGEYKQIWQYYNQHWYPLSKLKLINTKILDNILSLNILFNGIDMPTMATNCIIVFFVSWLIWLLPWDNYFLRIFPKTSFSIKVNICRDLFALTIKKPRV